MRYIIKVRAQYNSKVIRGDEIVEIGSKSLSYYGKVSTLKVGDSFVYDGVWYDVESISPACAVKISD